MEYCWSKTYDFSKSNVTTEIMDTLEYDALKKVVLAMHKWERPKENLWFY